jgi:hypothetical protein
LTVYQLAQANNMKLSDILLIGKVLYIPGSSGSALGGGSGGSGGNGGGTGSSVSASSSGSNPWTFCSTFKPNGGPWGQLPSLLADSPARLALRPLYVKWANHYGLWLPLLEAVGWQESGWQQNVVSSVGAIGAGQIMPDTAKFIMNDIIGQRMNINSVSDNIRMSAAFLSYLAHAEGNNLCATIAAYYEGPLNLSKYGVFPESQLYVASVEALIPRFE